MTSPTDSEIFDLAIKTHLVGFIAVAVAVHPDKVDLRDICAPANSAAIAFGRAILERWGKPQQPSDFANLDGA